MGLKKCNTCGAMVSAKFDNCPNCNSIDFISNEESSKPNNNEDQSKSDPTIEKASIGLNIVSFLIPIVGWILYFAIKSPVKAKSCGKWGCIGFFVNFVITLLIS